MRSLLLLLLLASCAASPSAPPRAVDLLIRGGTLHDGLGGAPVQADLAVVGERIAAIGKLEGWSASRTIDARGKIVCPGFIDLHTHCDSGVARDSSKANLNYLRQGVTTVVTGNCGGGEADTEALHATLAKQGVGTNVAHLLPHGSLRREAMGGSFDRAPSVEELERMKALVEEGMRAGAFGMSTGLIYAPSSYADREELVELAKVVARHGGIYASHIRSEGTGLLAAVEEAIDIGRRAGCPVQISHFKASGVSNHGKVAAACALIEWARARGMKVTCDQYPYRASSTSIAALLIPGWARVGGRGALLKRIDDPETGPRIRAAVAEAIAERGGPQGVLVSSFSEQPEWNGERLDAIAAKMGVEPVEAVVAMHRRGSPRGVSFSMCDEDVEYVMRKDYVATSSDGSTEAPSASRPHPRSYGAFPRKVGRYAIEKRALPLAQAIRSCSSLPAEILGLAERGVLEEGRFADIVVFDPERFRDRGTFGDPHQYATGVDWLIINGGATIADGEFTGDLSGRPLVHAP